MIFLLRVRRFPSFPVAVVTRYPVGRWGPGALSARDLGLVSPGAPPAGLFFFFFFFPSLKWELPSLPPGLVCPVLSAARLPSSVRCSCFSCFFFFSPLFFGAVCPVFSRCSRCVPDRYRASSRLLLPVVCSRALPSDRCGAPVFSSGRGLSRARRGTDIHGEWPFTANGGRSSRSASGPRASPPHLCWWCVEGRGAAVWPEC